MKDQMDSKLESYETESQTMIIIKSEFKQILKNKHLVRTIYQFAFMLIGFFFLNFISKDYSVENVLFYMGIFFVLIFVFPLPESVKEENNAFQDL